MMSNVIYLLIDPNKDKYNIKVGKHSGTLEKLSNRYRTYNPNHVVLLFIETDEADTIENIVKEEFYDNREINNKGNRSEWYECNLSYIMRYILKLCIKYTKEYLWSYDILCRDIYNGCYSLHAMKYMVEYLIRQYKIRYDSSGDEHGYCLSKDKITTLCYACYNIVNIIKGREDTCNITYEGMDEYEKHVRDVLGFSKM